MSSRELDWLAQAERDVESARHLEQGGYHEWAAFAAQQAAEKALKAVYQFRDSQGTGNVCVKLVQGLELGGTGDAKRMLACAERLDRYAAPSLYPDHWPEGAPKDKISAEDASSAVTDSDTIVRICHDLLLRR